MTGMRVAKSWTEIARFIVTDKTEGKMMPNKNDEAQRPVIDFLDAVRPSFESGQGVVLLQENMSDALILLAVKQAAAIGKRFMVVSASGFNSSVDIAVAGICVPGMDEATSYPSPAMLDLMNRTKQLTKQEMLERIDLLSGEMNANEEENKVMQDEITSLYAKIDALT